MDSHVARPGQVILVDDDRPVLAALKFRFETDGYDVVTLTSGEQLLDDPPRQERACIIIDQRLPDADGLQTIARLRAMGVTTPAILVTSHPSSNVRRRAAQAAVEIIEKPLLGEALPRSVAALLNEQQRR